MMHLVYLFVFWTDLPRVACQNCPSVEEAPSLKAVLDAFCRQDFGGFTVCKSLLHFHSADALIQSNARHQQDSSVEGKTSVGSANRTQWNGINGLYWSQIGNYAVAALKQYKDKLYKEEKCASSLMSISCQKKCQFYFVLFCFSFFCDTHWQTIND